MKEKPKYTNALAKETSPYLLQHAHNPVNWLPWGKKARQKAKEENKLMLISIGYSSCHWCHVMERESFEDEEVAEIMNRNFICIKVDREERPDVDRVYMEAVQAMQNQGGWPLNCFTTPDAKPVFGGTYFPKKIWIDILEQLGEMWVRDKKSLQDYGDNLANHMKIDGVLPILDTPKPWSAKILKNALKNWTDGLDNQYGGSVGAPKFAMPANYLFLLRYAALTKNQDLLNHVELTLDKMLQGGIHDQVGGGFARYATDEQWKVPHFEKMLYDNAQLLNLYNEAYKVFDKPDYLHVAKNIEAWLYREMEDASGSFYSAIDADSEGEEGKFYVYDPDELKAEGVYSQYAQFYKTNLAGIWENKFIAVRKSSLKEMSKELGLSTEGSQHWAANEVITELDKLNAKLLNIRDKRPRPLTDDKSLCSWNAMLAKAFIKSYRVHNDKTALQKAERILKFIEAEMYHSDTDTLSHSWKAGKASHICFIEDYAFTIEAYIALYRATFAENALHRALQLTKQANKLFYHEHQGFYFTTSHHQDDLIHRPAELSDNVIPAANSVMAHNLTFLASIFDITPFRQMAARLLHAVEKSMIEYPEGYANWANLYLQKQMGTPEVVIAGPKAEEFYQKLKTLFLPNIIFAVSVEKSSLPIFANRFKPHATFIYVCQNQTCDKPVEDIKTAKNQILKIYNPLEAA